MTKEHTELESKESTEYEVSLSKTGKTSHLNLRNLAESDEAIGLITDIYSSAFPGPKRYKKRYNALEAILADLLRNADDPTHTLYRSVRPSSFTGEDIGHVPFTAVINRLRELDLVEVTPGFKESTLPGAASAATEFKATDKLRMLAKDAGITPISWRSHFAPRSPSPTVSRPIELRGSSTKEFGRFGDKVRGERMRVDWSNPIVIAKARQVQEINAFLAVQDIELPDGAVHHGFRRIFGQGNRPDFNWNKAGRLYAIGGGYQALSNKPHKPERSKIRLNGEPTIELDITGSHVTVFHGLKRCLTFDPNVDPYLIPGIPRDVVKRWVTQAFGSNVLPNRWAKSNKDWFAEKHGGDIQRAYPAARVMEAVLAKHPVIGTWNGCTGIRWADLQYAESEAVIGAVHELCTVHGVPALPVHDSLIVPVSKRDLAEKVLGDWFEKTVGIRPAIEAKNVMPSVSHSADESPHVSVREFSGISLNPMVRTFPVFSRTSPLTGPLHRRAA